MGDLSWMRRVVVVAAVGLAAAALVLGVACSDDDEDGGGGEEATAMPTAAPTEAGAGDEDAAAIEAVVQAAVDGWNNADTDGLIGAFIDEAAAADFVDPSPDLELRPFLEQLGGTGTLTLGPVTVEVSGETATLEALEYTYDMFNQPQRFALVREAGGWLISGQEDLTIDPPEGATVIDVEMTEYAFTLDLATAPAGQVVLNVRNTGQELHEVAIAGVGIAWPHEPGTDGTVILTQPLEAGSYTLLCPVPTVDGQPHSDLGMTTEFVVE